MKKKIFIISGIVLTIAIVAGGILSIPTVAERVFVKRAQYTGEKSAKTQISAEEQQKRDHYTVQNGETVYTEEDEQLFERIKKEIEEEDKLQNATAAILEREYGPLESWAPDYETRLEAVVPRVQKLLDGKKLNAEDRATLERFMQSLRDDGLVE